MIVFNKCLERSVFRMFALMDTIQAVQNRGFEHFDFYWLTGTQCNKCKGSYMLRKSVIRKLNSLLQTKVQQSTLNEIWKLLMTYNNTQKFYSPPIANYPTYCHSKEFVTWVFCYKIVAFLKDSLSYSTNRRTLFLDRYFCCEVVLSWYRACCNCCWTGCCMSPAPRAALASVQLTDQDRDCSLNFQKKTWTVQISCSCKRICDWANCLFQTLHSPLWYFHLAAPFLLGSSSARTQLQEVWGSGHACCTLLFSCTAWTMRLSLWDQVQ